MKKIFYVVVCTNIQGSLFETFEGGKNAWMTSQEIEKLPKKFEGIAHDHKKYLGEQFIFEENVHRYSKSDY